ncbi:MAG TPA: ATP-binding cassette domain-containing protein, partial [Bacillota bacterium]|nr:ATP-binding cassette domain-containing protein [Bacillota bacterium]
MINVNSLTKTFRVPVREKGLKSALRSLIKQEYKTVAAVREICFAIAQGEVVGFLGPNGAGKTTTMKMLSGLLYPTSGTVNVDGYVPYQREKEYLKAITLVMGNRRRLGWNIPVIDSFELTKEIYDIPEKEYNLFSSELIEIMDIAELLNKPARNLSLGQRMKCEFVLSLLHKPKILYLDEPTIG